MGGVYLKYLLLGTFLSLIGSIVSLLVWDFDQIYKVPGILGLIFIGVSILLSGTLLSGPEMKANLATESAEDRTHRNNITFKSFLLCIPCFIIAGLLYYGVS